MPRLDDAIAHLFSAEIIEGQLLRGMVQRARARRRSARLDRMRSMHPAAGEASTLRRQAFDHGVDRIGAHGVAHIIDQMQHQEWSNG